MKSRKWFSIIFYAVFYSVAVSFFIFTSTAFGFENIDHVKITARDYEDVICKEMEKFNSSHVKTFMAKATPMPESDLQKFEVFPCHIIGVFKIKGAKHRFDIRPTGVASITNLKTRKSTLLGCHTCGDLFPPHPENPSAPPFSGKAPAKTPQPGISVDEVE